MDNIRFVWDIHYKCNYRCPYCWFNEDPVRILSDGNYIPTEEWVKRWDYLYEKYGTVHIEVTGGEPFIYPDFVNLIKDISKKHTIRITTNLSTNIDEFICHINSGRVKVISSFHPAFANFNSFFEKVLLLKEKGFGTFVVYVAYPPQFSLIEHYRKMFERDGLVFSPTPFCGIYKGLYYPKAYSEEERNILRQYLLNDENKLRYTLTIDSPKGKLCSAGQKSAILYADGKVARCGPLKNKVFTNFFDEDFSLLSIALPCEADFCPCEENKFIIS